MIYDRKAIEQYFVVGAVSGVLNKFATTYVFRLRMNSSEPVGKFYWLSRHFMGLVSANNFIYNFPPCYSKEI